MIAYKFLCSDGTGRFSGFAWPLPTVVDTGEWVDAEPVLCAAGIHACRLRDLPYWIDAQLYRIELEGTVVEAGRKVVAERGRLLERVESWDTDAMRDFSRDCSRRTSALAAAEPELRGHADDAAANAEAGNAAVVGFIAARAAELAGGIEAYEAERAAQVEWLVARLELE